jgi:hypothetical protein
VVKAVELGMKTPRPDLQQLGVVKKTLEDGYEDDLKIEDGIQEINLL